MAGAACAGAGVVPVAGAGAGLAAASGSGAGQVGAGSSMGAGTGAAAATGAGAGTVGVPVVVTPTIRRAGVWRAAPVMAGRYGNYVVPGSWPDRQMPGRYAPPRTVAGSYQTQRRFDGTWRAA